MSAASQPPESKAEARRLVVVALGSNLGDSERILRAAARELERLAARGFKVSSFHRTEPVDCPPGSPPFLNAVAVFEPRPEETPETLLEKLQALERHFGRQPKKVHNEPRPLDLDLIAFGEEKRHTPQLTLPHPRARQRAFVLEPLREVAPDFVWPE
ncbi:2-amino-4-hydroxy-6-hydroxymethyldihydropteridine diphosphokinase [Fontisphaera persica]|uniref:2-amino-4-hydroxy-6- hydroxymethyldihydropteridine diphosphokinase n=1 Tax=Fontisphaera persica TaxID=2974023 RepID=UPI0024BF8377|nr:2-amino-4-hydroxy-6-hydroxymethyldihydropteridine diphosphokinase [Fontisphaera persica]WCJ59517.1 2-amino-4-hydroxy-6-hydroxymethyldihydropteridine diphosphokinase [Fontisphaera persica]